MGLVGSNGYPIPADERRVETAVMKSRFLATLAPAPSEGAALALVARLREEFPEATHHCHAFLVGPPGSTRKVGFSDDGEPHDTAGRPMLDILLHSGVGDVACVVSRWFGGTKLGRGGLVRAYGGAVQAVLDGLETVAKVDWRRLEVGLDYGAVAAGERALAAHGAERMEARYGARVEWAVRVPAPCRGALVQALRDATRGAALIVDEDPD